MTSSAAGAATFERLSGAFRAACAARPDEFVERDYRIAGRPVRIRVAGRALGEAYDRPLAHLRSSTRAVTPDLVTVERGRAPRMRWTGYLSGCDPAAARPYALVGDDAALHRVTGPGWRR